MLKATVGEISDVKMEMTIGPAGVSLVTTEVVGCIGINAEKPLDSAATLNQFVTPHRQRPCC